MHDYTADRIIELLEAHATEPDGRLNRDKSKVLLTGFLAAEEDRLTGGMFYDLSTMRDDDRNPLCLGSLPVT